MANYLGAALLGLSQGQRDYEQNQKDETFKEQQRAATLNKERQQSRMAEMDLQQRQSQLDDANLMATIERQVASPKQPVPQQGGQQPSPAAASMQGASQPQQPPAAQQQPQQQQQQSMPADEQLVAPALKFDDPGIQARFEYMQKIPDQTQRMEFAGAVNQSLMQLPYSQQRQKALQQWGQAVQQPTSDQKLQMASNKPVTNPAAQANAVRESNGASPVMQNMEAARNAYAEQSKKYSAMAEKADDSPNGNRVSGLFRKKSLEAGELAAKEETKMVAIRKEQLIAKKESLAEIGNQFALFSDPKDITQDQYNDAQSILADNPEYKKMAGRLNLTGDVGEDRSKLARLAHMGETSTGIQSREIQKQTMQNAMEDKKNNLELKKLAIQGQQQQRQEVADRKSEEAATKKEASDTKKVIADQDFQNRVVTSKDARIPLDRSGDSLKDSDGLKVRLKNEALVTNFANVIKQVDTAEPLLQRMREINNLIITGPIAGRTAAFNANLVEMQSLSKQVATSWAKQNFPGRITNFDELTAQKVAAGVSMQPEANTSIINQFESQGALARVHANFMNDYFATNPKGAQATANRMWSKYMAANPLTRQSKEGRTEWNTKPKTYSAWRDSVDGEQQ